MSLRKNILIIGDSWGITSNYGKEHNWNNKEIYWPGSSLEYMLMQKGHIVFNKALGGASNRHQAEEGHRFLRCINHIHPIDIVIWFHTDVLRGNNISADNPTLQRLGFDGIVDHVAESQYKEIKTIKKEFPQTSWAIIGGHAALHPPAKHILDFADFRKDNWRSEILGVDVEPCQSLTHLVNMYDVYAKCIEMEILEREVAKRDRIEKLCFGRLDLFWDGVHPNYPPFRKLADELIDFYKL